jgi:hypothetical protein
MSRNIDAERRRRDYVRAHYVSARSVEHLTNNANAFFSSEIGAGLMRAATTNSIKKIAGRLGLHKGATLISDKRAISPSTEDKPMNVKTGIEIRLDGLIVVNWTNRTLVTDLGEFGSYTCNFTTHGAIQRYYVDVYEGKGHTAADTAQKFDFPHAKAVYVYAKIHGFTKSSVPQTDIEFEEGLTPEDAAKDTLQSLKRRAMRITEQKKWQETQRDADNWNNFKNTALYPLKDWIDANLPSYRPPVYRPTETADPFCGVVGVSDWHYMKYAYDHNGKTTYDRKKAQRALEAANSSLITAMMKHGRPERLYIPSGTDNLHVDTPLLTTTAGTSQVGQTDASIWQLNVEAYVDIVVSMVDLYSQIAPVTVVPMAGNHDRHVSYMLHVFLQKLYEKSDRVTVVRNYEPRVYQQYGSNALCFTHGDSMSQPKLKKSTHKFFMDEAPRQGIKMNAVRHFALFSGHGHVDQYEDLGVVKHFVIPSLAPSDSWHKEQGYVGSKKEASIYLFHRTEGRKAVIYS